MMMKSLFLRFTLFVAVLFFISIPAAVFGDGTEILGPPGIPIASGTGIAAGGTGMVTQPGTIIVNVPSGATVKQVLLYWDGQSESPMGSGSLGTLDDTISINGLPVTGALIGGPSYFFSVCKYVSPCSPVDVYSSIFSADITDKGWVVQGSNTLVVTGMEYNHANNGAGVLVIYDDGGPLSEIQIRDGLDLAYLGFPEPRKSTIPQVFNFAASSFDRAARLILFAGSVEDDRPGPPTSRPNSIEVTFGGWPPMVFSNYLQSFDGAYWDTLTLDIVVPIGANSMTVQVFSRDDFNTGYLTASLEWVGASLSVPIPTCGDGNVDAGEECDDGNLIDNDGCGNDCKLPVCGDGVTEDMEECDDGNLIDNDGCGNDCKLPVCGDGVTEDMEECDDGNRIDNDGCGNDCKLPVCGDGVTEGMEECDDGNLIDNDGCGNDCKLPVCGDGVKEGMEQCDDGNLVNGDGCSSACQTELRYDGCTPGYWKQYQHFDSWTAPYYPTTKFSSVFENAFPNKTLLQVLQGEGGGLIALGRHTVAALLNAQSGGVNYKLTVAEVISRFNSVFPGTPAQYEALKNRFESFNVQGCPLN
jgi:cysteine-rich repeat protein